MLFNVEPYTQEHASMMYTFDCNADSVSDLSAQCWQMEPNADYFLATYYNISGKLKCIIVE